MENFIKSIPTIQSRMTTAALQVDQREKPVLKSFKINTDFSLDFINELPIPGGLPCHLMVYRSNVFVACYASLEDRHELLQQLQNATKNPTQDVQQFWYRLCYLNDAVDFLPGTEEKLTDAALKQAFYDAMPRKWKERFEESGAEYGSSTRAEIVRYMRTMEKRAKQRHLENEASQRRAKKRNNRFQDEPRNESSGKSNSGTQMATPSTTLQS